LYTNIGVEEISHEPYNCRFSKDLDSDRIKKESLHRALLYLHAKHVMTKPEKIIIIHLKNKFSEVSNEQIFV
jgi:hypothetical protein